MRGVFSFYWYADLLHLHSFPTRRSSDLAPHLSTPKGAFFGSLGGHGVGVEDRKSTRLNSSHVATSYAVFCLKKKISTVMQAGDTIIDGGNTIFKDDVRRAGQLRTKEIPH